MRRECGTCSKEQTMACPNSSLCASTDDKPYWYANEESKKENKILKFLLAVFGIVAFPFLMILYFLYFIKMAVEGFGYCMGWWIGEYFGRLFR